jgi:hypothetical protein
MELTETKVNGRVLRVGMHVTLDYESRPGLRTGKHEVIGMALDSGDRVVLNVKHLRSGKTNFIRALHIKTVHSNTKGLAR